MEGYGVVFPYGSKTFEKTGFRQKRNFGKTTIFCKKNISLSFGGTFTFSNAGAIQIKLGTNELLKKKCARECRLLAKRIRS